MLGGRSGSDTCGPFATKSARAATSTYARRIPFLNVVSHPLLTGETSMSPETQSSTCGNPNIFSSVFAPTVRDYLPEPGSVGSSVLNHTTKIPSFVDTVSKDLCDDGRMGRESRDAAIGFITRSSASALVAGSTATLAAVGIATAGAPVTALALGAAALTVVPPAAEWVANKVRSFFGDLLARFKAQE